MACFKTFIRGYSIKAKTLVIPDENVMNSINANTFKPRKHPGIIKPKTVQIPDKLVKAILHCTRDYPVKALIAASEDLNKHLKGKVPPMEKTDIHELSQRVQKKVWSNLKHVELTCGNDEIKLKQMVQEKANNILRKKIYNWKPIKYDTYNSLLYLMGRSAAEYAVLAKIFGEISSRDPKFKPRSLFDFGSGVGTATWAANIYWKEHIFEYFNVDISSDMNDLAQILLQGGTGTGILPLKGVFYRQFLPISKTSYDLTISAYSMMELPSLEARIATVLNLWNKTEKYLVIVEQGTNAGFKIINEIRDFILEIDKEANGGYVFSPCPHDDTCPRFLLDDGTPCNFEVTYFTLAIGKVKSGTPTTKQELYSYIVLKKGKRTCEDLQWPRIVRPALVRSKHTICRVCTADGKLDEVIFTASKHGKITYHCARASKWGDLLPVTLKTKENKSNETTDDKSNETTDDNSNLPEETPTA